MNLNQLKYFVTLARMEHYTRAAAVLEISQPTLSHAMNALERELGTRLFAKRGRNVSLTKYGQVFLEYAKEALEVLELGVKKVKSMTGPTGGDIELAYIYTLGSEFIPQLVGDFLRLHEELQITFHFTVGNTHNIIQGIKEEKYDIAFCSMAEDQTGVEFTPVGREKLVIAVPKGHPLTGEKRVHLEQAAAYPQISYTRNSGLRPVVDKLFKNAGLKPEIAYEIEEDGSMAGLVAQNFGIAVMPDIPILHQLDVEILDIHEPEQPRYIYMAQVKDRYQIPVVKKFAEFVKRRQHL